MGTNTGIEWTDSTWSPIRVWVKPNAAAIARAKGYQALVPIAEKMAGRVGQHCEHVSPGCQHCYAETNNHRCLPANGTGLPYDRRSRDLVEAFVDEKILLEPLRWKTVASDQGSVVSPGGEAAPAPAASRRPRRIFVENQSDLFAEWVSDEMLDRVFAVMALCPQHIFQVLTKRPGRMLAYMNGIEGHKGGYWRDALIEGATQKLYSELHPTESHEAISLNMAVHMPLPNVWLGVSVENQAAADARIPLLLQTPAAVRFISAEPLLGMVTPKWLHSFDCMVEINALEGSHGVRRPHQGTNASLDWVICGGESGPGARPMNPNWARNLRNQCQAADVPFFFKQWGAYSPAKGGKYIVARDGHIRPRHETLIAADCRMTRERKKSAVALLDGRAWKEFPKPQ